MTGEMKSAQGGATFSDKPRPKVDNKLKFIILGAVMGVGAIAVLIILVSGGGNGSSLKDCEVLQEPIVVAGCLAQFCTFDTSTCGIKCPLGYEMDEKSCPVSCECAGSGTYQGDVAFSEHEVPDLIDKYSTHDSSTSARMSEFELFAGSALNKRQQWPTTKIDGRVHIPYILTDNFKLSTEHVRVLKEAIEIMSANTCIDFVPKKNEAAYIKFVIGVGCSSMVGKYPKGEKPQRINLGEGCQYTRTVIHEMIHAMGFLHEQCRPDRDTFIDIMWDNIKEDVKYNFEKIDPKYLYDYDSPYDVKSIMHYPSTAFTIDKTMPSIKIKDGNLVGENGKMTEEDINEINLYYECLPKSETASWGDWGQWTKPDKTCGTTKICRFRKCLDGEKPADGCEGDEKEIKDEVLEPCPAEPEGKEWQPWSEWSKCSRKCAGGLHFRYRYCPEGGCKGKPVESEACNTAKCLVNPDWGKWEEWSECTATCGGGLRTSKRHCWEDDDLLVIGCEGSEENFQEKTEECNTASCDGDAGGSSEMTGGGQHGGSEGGAVGETTVGPTGKVFTENPEKINSDLCTSGVVDYFASGDMDADGNSDVFCQASEGKFYISQSDGASFTKKWDGDIEGCDSPFRLMVDVKNDKRDAVICLDPANNQYGVVTKSQKGSFIKKVENDKNICQKSDVEYEYLSIFSAKMKELKAPVVMCHYGDVLSNVQLNA